MFGYSVMLLLRRLAPLIAALHRSSNKKTKSTLACLAPLHFAPARSARLRSCMRRTAAFSWFRRVVANFFIFQLFFEKYSQMDLWWFDFRLWTLTSALKADHGAETCFLGAKSHGAEVKVHKRKSNYMGSIYEYFSK